MDEELECPFVFDAQLYTKADDDKMKGGYWVGVPFRRKDILTKTCRK